MNQDRKEGKIEIRKQNKVPECFLELSELKKVYGRADKKKENGKYKRNQNGEISVRDSYLS